MRTILIAAALLAVVPGAAVATPRASDADFVALAQCAGFAKGKATQELDYAPLQRELRSQSRGRAEHVLEQANEAEFQSRRQSNAAKSEAAVADARAARDQACAPFAATDHAVRTPKENTQS